MASSLAAAFAEIEGPELDAAVGYTIPLRRRAPTEESVKAAFAGVDYGPFRRIARMLSRRYRCHETDAEDAVQDSLLELYDTRQDIFREDPEHWQGLLYRVARFRLIDIQVGQEKAASVESLAEGSNVLLHGAQPCIPQSGGIDEEARLERPPSGGEEWTPTQILGALQRFRDFHGRPPKAKECKALHGLPRLQVIHKHFGDFATAILEAGMIPEALGRRRNRWTAEEAARVCEAFRHRNGRWPDWGDLKRTSSELPSTSVMIKFFGGTRAIDVQLGAEAILAGAA
jgi:DNA-directed RNA polymerase specialized sigma24 family protein